MPKKPSPIELALVAITHHASGRGIPLTLGDARTFCGVADKSGLDAALAFNGYAGGPKRADLDAFGDLLVEFCPELRPPEEPEAEEDVLDGLKVPELVALARELKIKDFGKMKKDELVVAVRAAQEAAAAEGAGKGEQ